MLNRLAQSWHNLSGWPQHCLDYLSDAQLPRLYYAPHGQLRHVLSKLPQLSQKYRPTLWLKNPHAQLVYLDVIKKKKIKLEYDAVDQLTMQDGGVTGIAWLGLNLPADTPTVMVLHTITGSPQSMAELVQDLHRYTGWRIALCLRRGHANLPMPVPKISLFGFTDDLREQIAAVQKQFPQSALYAVGSSAGTGLLVRYLGEQGQETPFKAAFALSPGYNTESGFEHVHPFYSKLMTKKLFKSFIEPYQHTWQSLNSLPQLLQTKTLAEFNQHYIEMTGFKDYDSYCRATNPIYVFENIKIPTMVLNAEDDPICHIKNFEHYKQQIQNMQHVMVVTTKRGSHCGFYEGFRQTRSWGLRLMADFLKLQHQLTKNS